MHGALMRLVQTRLFEVLVVGNERETGDRGTRAARRSRR